MAPYVMTPNVMTPNGLVGGLVGDLVGVPRLLWGTTQSEGENCQVLTESVIK